MNKTYIPYGRQSIDASDIRAVTHVLRSERLTQGPEVERFEKAFAKYCGAPYAVAVSSGTAGLHLATLAAGFGPNDDVITTPMSFVATANSILYAGAQPRFVDIDDRTLGLDPHLAKKSLNQRTKGLIAVHFAGQPWRGAVKNGLEPKKNFCVIEDACHALGAEIEHQGRWERVGSGRYADMTVFSFHPVKHITTGEGGMVTTRRKDLYERLLLLRSHGIERDPSKFKRGHIDEPWYYEMQALGFNYRITDIQCALGLSQMSKLGDFIARRRDIAAYYDRRFSGLAGLRTPERIAGTRSSHHLYILRMDFNRFKTTRGQFMRALSDEGVGTQVHYIPITDQPYYQKRGGQFEVPVCQKYYEEALSIPIFPDLKKMEMIRVADSIEKMVLRSSHGQKR